MSNSNNPTNIDRRGFLRTAASVGTALGAASQAMGAAKSSSAKSAGRVLGANDKINVAVIGVGGRGTYVGGYFGKIGMDSGKAQVLAVCDVYKRRVTRAQTQYNEKFGVKPEGTLDWREVINRPDIDAVVVATPDHWHAPIALAAMDKGKDVYLEKPMCHTVEEAKQLSDTVRETKRVLQVGSQTTSGDQWHKAKKAISDGMIGKMLMSQGSYHRNSIEGEWNWDIDASAGPDKTGEDFIDWKMWLGNATKRSFDADRFFRFRKYWDYSGGIATDLFFHVAAPMNICWGTPQFPHKVMAGGGIYAFKDREVPDTFHLIAEYDAGHSVVLSSSMANSQHIPGLVRGKDASLIMVEHGRFEGYSPFITVKPERAASKEYLAKFGKEDIKIEVEKNDTMITHVTNFLDCMRSRQKPTLDVDTASRAQVLISMAVQSYREGRVLYFDEKRWKVTDKAPKA